MKNLSIMNLADPELELIDPTPNIHSLFLCFDKTFFWSKLECRTTVRWSKRMYSTAGSCTYSSKICDIALSEPLLKLRSRKDLVETLLHEMIHAYLFISNIDSDRDGHGPNFLKHMDRINKAACLNISVYHDFHSEVELYQTHWWRCTGKCQNKKPYFGIVRRSSNRAPGPSDYWWDQHKKICGGIFVKIKEPTSKKNKNAIQDTINTSNKLKTMIKSSSSSATTVTKKINSVFSPVAKPPVAITPVKISGIGHTINNNKSTTNSPSVVDTVRNIWTNKQIPATSTDKLSSKNVSKPVTISKNVTKHEADDTIFSPPPAKIKKIDDYFKSNATSVLKDIYGQDFVIKEVNSNKRLSVIPVQSDLVDCPVCSGKISTAEINRHLDECLNTAAIETICKENSDTKSGIAIKPNLDETNNNIPTNETHASNTGYNSKPVKTENIPFPKIKSERIDLPYNNDLMKTSETIVKKMSDCIHFINTNTQLNDKQISTYTSPKVEQDFKTSPSSSDNEPKIKIEPGCSKDFDAPGEQKCPCCGDVVTDSNEHFDECLGFFDNNTTIPTEGASTSATCETIVIDDDDIFDETSTLNASGTKLPCPCCLNMIELAEMNEHLDMCLN